jgi:hypothetical protein
MITTETAVTNSLAQRSRSRRVPASPLTELANAPAGRPDQLNEAKAQVIFDAVRAGSTLDTAAAWAGVTGETLRRWRRKGEAAQAVPPGHRNPTERKYAAFCGVLDQALAECAVRAQAVLFEAIKLGEPTPSHAPTIEERRLAVQTAQWWLTHRQRDDYTTRQEVVGREGGPVLVETDAERDINERLEKLKAVLDRPVVEEQIDVPDTPERSLGLRSCRTFPTSGRSVVVAP